ncbi:Uncharacterized protease [Seminavis robusta]|uniref:Uncharacterized protease n=1 Tax=Seminavis robusta TaxID=568900 RepID=A0A9N8E292_9STRA|nr:Uncharacterized protease [Seminavis robusta]|eukprot:Sro576_g169530.1 Uncharacterized protease (1027) ;mRNA; f:30759-33839
MAKTKAAMSNRPWQVALLVALFLPIIAYGLSLPSQELVNRRKSPALWRYDLAREDGHDDVPSSSTTSSQRLLRQPPEVMAPVGGWPQLHAAIANGADAIYLGLSAFSARARAANFDPVAELPKAVELCHASNVKVYVAMNTLVFPDELQEVEELIRLCHRANVDALIVQDLGMSKLVQKVGLELRASTQQTITSADGAEFSANVTGATRVVLGRELSVAEIKAVTTKLQDQTDHDPVEVEAFVHGALCVSLSGQCFSSEAWGGRSANRGQCAQACRLPYGLVDNGQLKEMGDFSYLLSPQDLCGLDHVPALVRAGVSCLKIEGRLKDAAYVAATTRAYRNAVDQAWKEYMKEEHHNNSQDNPTEPRVRPVALPDEEVSKAELAQLFSRGQDEEHDGLSSGFFDGSHHQNLVRGRSPRHRGIHCGRVLKGTSGKKGLLISLDASKDLKRGDGLVIDRGLAQEEELGGPIFDVQIQEEHKGERVALVRFSKSVEKKWKQLDDRAWKQGAIQLAPAGAHVWKTSDATVSKKMKRLSEAPIPKLQRQARVTVEGSIGAPLVVTIRDETTGREGVGTSEGVLQPAEKKSLDEQSISKAIGTLGNTDWELLAINGINSSRVEAGAWCPAGWIKECRRQAVEELQAQILVDGRKSQRDHDVDSNSLSMDEPVRSITDELLSKFGSSGEKDEPTKRIPIPTALRLSVLARNYDHVETVCKMIEDGQVDSIDEIIVDFLEVDGMRDAVNRIRQVPATKAVVASPRIIKPGESGIWRTLLRLQAHGLLVRSAGLLNRMTKLGGQGARVEVDVPVSGERNSVNNRQAVVIPELIADFSLNVANPLSAWELLSKGCSRVTASYDLNADGITNLLESMGNINEGSSRIDIIAHAHLPVFHTEHCVFARFLTKGDSYLDCGHACTRHNVHLRDQTGADHLVLADMGCRNTVFGSEAQSGVHSLKDWSAAGASRFRIELVDETGDDVRLIVGGYASVMNGKQRASELWESLKLVRDSNGRTGGVSHGSLTNSPVRRAGEIR